ncbi:MAG: hypothetical protein EOM74_00560 [Methanomicrobia archaeon]|nr:hypothetical protein [Methanomicrobia archaeon]
MYDGYANIYRSYFPKALHVVDLFHVITQLTTAVNRLRTQTMNAKARKGSVKYNFMKGHWKYFLYRKNKTLDEFMDWL